MFRGLTFLCLWTILLGFILAETTTTIPSSAISTTLSQYSTTQITENTSATPFPSSFTNNSTNSPTFSTAIGTSNVSASLTTTTKSPFITLTGTTSKTAPTASTTGSGAFKNGVGMCLGLMATTLVAVVLL